MPPVKKRDFVVVLYDVNTESYFRQQSRDVLLDITNDKFFSDTRDEMKLVLLNTESTSHTFENVLDYKHITEPFDESVLCGPNVINDHIRLDINPGKGNWLEGLYVAIQTLIRTVKDRKEILTKQLIFVSDLSTPLEKPHEELVDDVVSSLNKHEIYLYVLGPKVKIKKTTEISNPIDDIRQLKDSFTLESVNKNVAIVNHIIESSVNSISCDLGLASEIVKLFKKHKGLQPWYCPLSIGTVLEIPTCSRRLIRPPNTTFKEIVEHKTVWKWVKSEDSDKTVNHDNVISGFQLHNKFIPLTDDVKKTFKHGFGKCFKILGIMDMKSLPQHYICGEATYCVTGDYRIPKSVQIINTLIDYFHKNNLCLRVGKVYAKNCRMQMIVLIPKPAFKPKCFFAAELPSVDDVPFKYVECKVQDNTINVNSGIRKSGYKYLDSVDLEKNEISIMPSLSRDIYIKRLFAELLKKTSGLNLDTNTGNLLNLDITPEMDGLLDILPRGQNAD